jgi:hypothetical protein
MGGGLDSRCVGRVYCADGAVHKSRYPGGRDDKILYGGA